MNADFDLAIIGSGFGGSLMAMVARRLGHSVVLLERQKHPRFAIGESSTPLANLLLEELARRHDLPRLLPLAKWGTWQRNYPELPCGLKRGFTFYQHTFGQPWTPRADRGNELLVAASPRDDIADTHWYRADFDHFLVGEAQRLGVEYLDESHLAGVAASGAGVELTVARPAGSVRLRVRFVVDASGPGGALPRLLGLRSAALRHLPPTEALFTHFRNVRRWDELHPQPDGVVPPYPVDDAAVHHVFPGGWVWVLRFNHGVTSAGVAAEAGTARDLRLAEGAPAWARLLERLPSLRELFGDATAQLPFVHAPRLAFRCEAVAGERWALLPSAAGFIDPLLSTGFPLTLLGIARLGEILRQPWDGREFSDALQGYAVRTREELETVEQLVAALYRSMDDFPRFTALSLLYFAAASFSEAARRLDRAHLAGRFLLGDHPTFGPALRACLARALGVDSGHGDPWAAEIPAVIEPVNVAGLARPERRNWYPAAAADLLEAGAKLDVGREQIAEMLARVGF